MELGSTSDNWLLICYKFNSGGSLISAPLTSSRQSDRGESEHLGWATRWQVCVHVSGGIYCIRLDHSTGALVVFVLAVRPREEWEENLQLWLCCSLSPVHYHDPRLHHSLS